MELTKKARARIRIKQNRLIRLGKQHGYPDSIKISTDAPDGLTLENIRRFLFPEYEPMIDRVISEMERFGARRTRERRTRENRDRTESQLAQPSDFDIPGPKIHVDYSPLKKEQL